MFAVDPAWPTTRARPPVLFSYGRVDLRLHNPGNNQFPGFYIQSDRRHLHGEVIPATSYDSETPTDAFLS